MEKSLDSLNSGGKGRINFALPEVQARMGKLRGIIEKIYLMVGGK